MRFEEIENSLSSGSVSSESRADALLVLDHALNSLGEYSERQMRVIECRYFGGMSIQDTALALHVSAATVKRDQAMGQAWLYRRMQEG